MTDRAVSTTLNYVLSLGIATLLITGLLIAGGTFVDDRRQDVIRSEMEVIGEQVAADLARADRLVQAGEPGPTVQINNSLPDRITGSTYQLSLEPARHQVVLNSTHPTVSVRVDVSTRTDLGASIADGGGVVVQYDAGADVLEVTND